MERKMEEQVGQGFPVMPAHKEKMGIGRNGEGRFA